MAQSNHIVEVQGQFRAGARVSEVLRYLAIDCGIEDQVELMLLVSKALGVSLGAVTAIGGWWHENPKELNDEDVDAYLMPVVTEFLAND
jgi:hypothetical protein